MGLLSDPEYGSAKWVQVLRKIHSPLGILCYIGALGWFFMLGNRAFNNETYFSENALLPGLVTNGFNGEQSAKRFYNELLRELEDKYEDTNQIPVPWLVGKMSQLQLEVYTHNFTLNFPLGAKEIYAGTNVYGILRAPRTSSQEALVVSAPYRNEGTHQKGTAAGIALMLAFAEFARPQRYWAKDIIFLVTEHEQLGMQAWLEAYHGLQAEGGGFYSQLGAFLKYTAPTLDLGQTDLRDFWQTRVLDAGTLRGRSGSIQAAINLEFHTPKIQYVEVKVEGLNGQLPNLDLVNLVHKLCVKSGIHHSYKNSFSWVRPRGKMEDWLNGFSTMVEMVVTQMAGVPNGNHGLFHRFGIEALTLEGRGANDPAGDPPRVSSLSHTNFHRLGSALESVLRSLNNLLERFHQSYFFYMLAATDRFISIGQYMPCLCLLCGAMLVRALALWVSIQKDEEDKPVSTQSTGPDQSKESDKSADEQGSGEEKAKKKRKRAKRANPNMVAGSVSVVNIGVNFICIHLMALVVMHMPKLLAQLGTYWDLQTEASVYYGLLCVGMIQVAVVPLMWRLTPRLGRDEMTLVTALMLVELATLCLSVGMHNFPLGLCLGALYTPLALMAGSRPRVRSALRSKVHALKVLACVLFHPLLAVTIGLMLYSTRIYPEDGVFTTMSRGLDAASQAVLFSVVDSMIYGNWLFNVVSTLVLPVWLLCLQSLTYRLDD